MPCGPVEWNEPWTEAMTEAIDRASETDLILEMKTYRYRGHSMSDAQLYRSEEVEEYKKIDPLHKF
jgi:pyruvate dehydrogenase E1 component alpha subunit